MLLAFAAASIRRVEKRGRKPGTEKKKLNPRGL